MTVTTLPRTVVKAYLAAARVPVNAAARVAGQRENQQWPPALAFEGFEAGVETVVGSLLRDETLVEAGRLRQAKVSQLRKAAQLETLADTTRERAQEEFSERREQAQQKRQQVDQQARQREQQVAQDEQRAKAAAEAKAAKKTTAAASAKRAQEQVIERRERAATAEALTEEASALQTQEAALDKAETADAIDASIDASKAARKSG